MKDKLSQRPVPPLDPPEVARDHVEWLGGQGHYDPGYADGVRLIAEMDPSDRFAYSVRGARRAQSERLRRRR